jgi:hypothetical protein
MHATSAGNLSELRILLCSIHNKPASVLIVLCSPCVDIKRWPILRCLSAGKCKVRVPSLKSKLSPLAYLIVICCPLRGQVTPTFGPFPRYFRSPATLSFALLIISLCRFCTKRQRPFPRQVPRVVCALAKRSAHCLVSLCGRPTTSDNFSGEPLDRFTIPSIKLKFIIRAPF